VAPAQERSKDTVEVLLEATERVSRRVGFEAATTKEIAAIAGVSIGTLYRYYPSKEALLAALVRRQWAEGLRWLGERMAVMQPGPFDETVDRVVRTTFTMIAERLAILGTMRIETDNVVHLGAELIDAAAAFVEQALERRHAELAVEDVRVASLIAVRTVVFLARIGVRDYPDLVASGRYPAEVARMVRRYLTLPGPPSGP